MGGPGRQDTQTAKGLWEQLDMFDFEHVCTDYYLGCSEELTFIFYNVPSFLSGAHICLIIRNLRMNNGAV